MIKSEIVAHSLSPQGDELISVLCTFPRIILAEVNTHRMLSKNTSSSRAIPFRKMVKAVLNNPCIPIAFQKEHTGMQGFEYLPSDLPVSLGTFTDIMMEVFKYEQEEIEEESYDENIADILIELLDTSIEGSPKKTLVEWWLYCRDQAVKTAILMSALGVTKQLCNRLLEPFMWTTMLITGSREGWDNFFHLRCPNYETETGIYKSKKDAGKYAEYGTVPKYFDDIVGWLQLNKGQAEIHIMDLAEKIYDAVNESKPKQLQAGEWHIPFRNKIDYGLVGDISHNRNDDNHIQTLMVKISTAMAARTSYTVVGEEKGIDYKKMIELHDRLLSQEPPHSSPLEHCARAMSDEEYYEFFKGRVKDPEFYNGNGWCFNLKGFIPYRYMIDNNYK